jgi:hypothetical protein
MSRENLLPIDAVITWVDGQDPNHLQKLNTYLAEIGGHRPRTADPTRFHNDGEINYCVVSLLKYAPWLRTIYIVTDNQIPDIFKELKSTAWENKVRIVDHKEIFSGYEYLLPSFNARSIITMVWRIQGLSERFLLLNDDFALIRPVKPAHFFYEQGIVVRGKWERINDKPFINFFRYYWSKWFPKSEKQKLKDRAKHRGALKNAAKLAGFSDRYLFINHEPRPLRVSTIRDFFSKNPELFVQNITPKLRSPNQFLNEALATYLEIRSDCVVFDNSVWALKIDPPEQDERELRAAMQRAKDDDRCLFVCVQSLEKASPELHKYIIDWLNRRIGTLQDLIELPISHS